MLAELYPTRKYSLSLDKGWRKCTVFISIIKKLFTLIFWQEKKKEVKSLRNFHSYRLMHFNKYSLQNMLNILISMFQPHRIYFAYAQCPGTTLHWVQIMLVCRVLGLRKVSITSSLWHAESCIRLCWIPSFKTKKLWIHSLYLWARPHKSRDSVCW